ncbi:MAG: Purine nucleoside phosphoramidase [Chlamydiales bacterium]|nr:Purine nucleoside phosphoramidase [Chlamydiales bacterium]MCH9619193.1 Purine nucleoside phosphoramidase [Chlamydiales bacterium]MCH9622455.1 Purine nucleoside phosphoramidase [Chlamydiales bacterium]
MKTLFEKIIDRELPAEIVYENEHVIAIKDKFPKAPIHLLIVPKKMIPSLQEMERSDYPLLGEIVEVAKQLAEEFDLTKKGYRLLVNNGTDAGQTIFHLHFHLLGGHMLGEMG